MSSQYPPRKQLLFVDDEAGIRETMPRILEMHGFDVTTAATVIEALQAIADQRFDVLISDLNIGHPGDGFMVVHAMRQRHPECVTFILTGYPAFETALQAIRSQVDDYLIKPASPTVLISAIQSKLDLHQRTFVVSGRERLASILSDHPAEIAKRTLEKSKNEPPLDALALSDAERIVGLEHKQALLRVKGTLQEGNSDLRGNGSGLFARTWAIRRSQSCTIDVSPICGCTDV